jgi:hypothetical protein
MRNETACAAGREVFRDFQVKGTLTRALWPYLELATRLNQDTRRAMHRAIPRSGVFRTVGWALDEVLGAENPHSRLEPYLTP